MAKPAAAEISRKTKPSEAGPRSSLPIPNRAMYTITHPSSQSIRLYQPSWTGATSGAKAAMCLHPAAAGRTRTDSSPSIRLRAAYRVTVARSLAAPKATAALGATLPGFARRVASVRRRRAGSLARPVSAARRRLRRGRRPALCRRPPGRRRAARPTDATWRPRTEPASRSPRRGRWRLQKSQWRSRVRWNVRSVKRWRCHGRRKFRTSALTHWTPPRTRRRIRPGSKSASGAAAAQRDS